MAKTVVGLFDDHHDAERAVRTLLDRKFIAERISIVTADPRGEFQNQELDRHGNKASQGAWTGATSGALVGGIFGVLLGAGVLAFPALGLVAAGPIVGALAGAGIGAVGGGLLGGLIGMGIPEEHAHTYAEAVRRGGVLVTAEVDDADVAASNDIMKRHGAVDVTTRTEFYRQQGFQRFDPNAKPLSEEETAREREALRNYYGATTAGSTGMAAGAGAAPTMAGTGGIHSESTANTYPSAPVDDPRQVFEAQFANRGMSYQQFEEGYVFGRDLHLDPRYDREWTIHQEEIRREWEAGKPGSWEIYRDPIYAGWARGLAQRRGPTMM